MLMYEKLCEDNSARLHKMEIVIFLTAKRRKFQNYVVVWLTAWKIMHCYFIFIAGKLIFHTRHLHAYKCTYIILYEFFLSIFFPLQPSHSQIYYFHRKNYHLSLRFYIHSKMFSLSAQYLKNVNRQSGPVRFRIPQINII